MFDELVKLESAITDFERDADDDFVDPRRLSAAIDRLQGKLCRVVAAAKKRNQHLLSGQSACSWVARECHSSPFRPSMVRVVPPTGSSQASSRFMASTSASARRCLPWAPARCPGATAC